MRRLPRKSRRPSTSPGEAADDPRAASSVRPQDRKQPYRAATAGQRRASNSLHIRAFTDPPCQGLTTPFRLDKAEVTGSSPVLSTPAGAGDSPPDGIDDLRSASVAGVPGDPGLTTRSTPSAWLGVPRCSLASNAPNVRPSAAAGCVGRRGGPLAVSRSALRERRCLRRLGWGEANGDGRRSERWRRRPQYWRPRTGTGSARVCFPVGAGSSVIVFMRRGMTESAGSRRRRPTGSRSRCSRLPCRARCR